MPWPYDFQIGDLMRRADQLRQQHSAEVHEALAPYPKRRRSQQPKLRKPRKGRAHCVYCGVEVVVGKMVCWAHDEDMDGEW